MSFEANENRVTESKIILCVQLVLMLFNIKKTY